MKRSREEEIMLNALQAVGYCETSMLKDAVSSGLKAIRREKYEDHIKRKRKGSEADEGGETVTQEQLRNFFDILLGFVERASKEGATTAEVEALPAVAHVLAEFHERLF